MSSEYIGNGYGSTRGGVCPAASCVADVGCVANACGLATCGSNACGVDGCVAAGCVVNACPINGCGTDTCVLNLTPLPGPLSDNEQQ